MRRRGSSQGDAFRARGDGSWAVRLPFSAFGAKVLLLADDVAYLPRLEEQVPLGASAGYTGAPHRVLRLVTAPQCALLMGRRLVRCARYVDPLLAVLRRQLQLTVARFARDYLFVHAGVVAWQGRAMVVPGRSFSGKSTLVAALLAHGADYMSDEFALIDANGAVTAYPRPLALRTPGGGRSRVSIDGTPSHAVPIGTVLLTRWLPDRQWRPRTASVAEGVLGLLANTVGARDTPRRAFEIVKRAVSGATVLAGERGEAAETAISLLNGPAWWQTKGAI